MDIEWLQQHCLAWPATSEEVKWEQNLCFMVAKKMFCLYGLDDGRISFKVTEDQFEELSGTDGFMPAPYFARAKWVTVIHPEKVGKKEMARLLRQAYEIIRDKLPKKLKAEYGL